METLRWVNSDNSRLVYVIMVVPDVLKLMSSPPEQNGRHFADDIFKCIFMNEKFCISIDKKVSIGSGNGLAPNRRQAITWTNADPVHRSTHICDTRGRWVNSSWASDAIRWHRSGSTLVQAMACCPSAPSHYLAQCHFWPRLILTPNYSPIGH